MSSGAFHVRGKLSGLDTKPNPHNFNRTNITKMTVTDKDGTRYHGTRPTSLKDAEIGDEVVFTADIKRSSEVKQWFFFQRPRMAEVVS